MINPGIIFIWTGTHASIPSGWSRVTALDNYFAKGTAASTNPGTTGGAATHTHTTSSHTHSIAAHTHTISLSAGTGSSASTGLNTTASKLAHTHNSFTSGAVASASVSTENSSYGSCSNNPPYYTVIFVTPAAATEIIPTGVITLADAAITGMSACDGSGSTPNLVGKYLLGADTAADAGGTGGSTTNVHALSHVHTTSHAHATATSPGPNETNARSQSGTANVVWGHNHDVTPNAATPSSTDNVSLTTTETVEPAYKKLLALMNDSAGKARTGVIGLWLGTLATIPTGWILCDGGNGTEDMRGMHLKITATAGEVGDTGGSNTHTHAAQGHTHTISHSHTCPNVSHSGGSAVRDSGYATTVHASYHTVSTNAVNMTLASANTSADSSSNEPVFKTVAFIKLIYHTSPAMLLSFMK